MAELENWPLYFKERLLIGNLDSDVGIVTLWTPKEVVAKDLSSNDYAVIGQLYTKRGINFILRNILARPSIRRLIITGQDLSGSGEALLALVKEGVEPDSSASDQGSGRDGRGKVIKGIENGFIDREITDEAIEAFRKNVEIIDNRNEPVGATRGSPEFAGRSRPTPTIRNRIGSEQSARSIRVTLKEPLVGVAPGQSAVFYVGEELVGGGVIC